MAKVSFVISKNSNGNAKSNFHFDGNAGSGKWFSKIFNGNTGKHENASEPNEITDLISKLVVDGDYTIAKSSETRIEFDGSPEEIKEFAAWSINQIKAEAGALKAVAELVKDYCKAIVDTFKGIFGYTEHVDQVTEERNKFKAENARLLNDLETLKNSAKKENATD
jgi:hypothetical protein